MDLPHCIIYDVTTCNKDVLGQKLVDICFSMIFTNFHNFLINIADSANLIINQHIRLSYESTMSDL